MNLIALIVPIILGFVIGYTAMNPNNDEPIHIKLLGSVTASILTYPIIIALSILT